MEEVQPLRLATFDPIEFDASVDVWGLAGWGNGELTLTQHANADRAEARYTTDIALRMGALGVRGQVVSPDEAGGLSIAVKSDAIWVTTESDAVTNAHGNLGASEGDASRVRLLVEGSRQFDTAGGAFTPSLEVGLRHDGGDAETGFGLEAGAGFAYTSGALTVEGRIRTLVAHEESGYREWGAPARCASTRALRGGGSRSRWRPPGARAPEHCGLRGTLRRSRPSTRSKVSSVSTPSWAMGSALRGFRARSRHSRHSRSRRSPARCGPGRDGRSATTRRSSSREPAPRDLRERRTRP